MKLAFCALVDAVRLHLSPDLAAKLPAAFAAMKGVDAPPGEVTDAEAGELILRAVLGHAVPVVELDRAWLLLAQPIELDRDDATSHPLLAPWLEPTLTDLIAAPIVAGARFSNASPLAPGYADLQVTVSQFGVHASAQMAFKIGDDSLMVVVRYGEAAAVPISTTHTLSGRALYAVGSGARSNSRPGGNSVPPAGGGGAKVVVETEPPLSGALH